MTARTPFFTAPLLDSIRTFFSLPSDGSQEQELCLRHGMRRSRAKVISAFILLGAGRSQKMLYIGYIAAIVLGYSVRLEGIKAIADSF